MTAFSIVALGGSAFLLDRLGMKGVHWRVWAPALQHRGDPIPEGALGGFVQGGGTPAGHQTFHREGSSYAWATKGGSVFLLFRDGETTATGYLARDVVAYQLAVRYPFGDTFYAEVAPCEGEAVFAGGIWTLQLAVPACRVANGTWAPLTPVAPVQTDDRACTQFVACACDLALVRPDVFAQTCEDTRRMIGIAHNDSESCRSGLNLARSLALPLAISLPLSCADG